MSAEQSKTSRSRQALPLVATATLCVLLGILTALLAQRYLTLRRSHIRLSAALTLAPHQRVYYDRLRKHLGYPEARSGLVLPRDVLDVTGKLNVRANHFEGLAAGSEVSCRPRLNKVVPLPLTSKRVSIELPDTRHYQYEIVNEGKKSATGPILYQNVLWDTARHLVESGGFLSIEDEVERAKALWRFVAENRYHFWPVTESLEEEDVVKYLAVYGYGFCDDTARILAQLARLAGLRGRIWDLHGHVVAELFAAGRWCMLDADHGVYFYKHNKPNEIYGVAELASNPSLFSVYEACGRIPTAVRGAYRFVDMYTTVEDNRLMGDTLATASHRIRYKLRPGERIVFGTMAYGKYFMGGYPQRVPEFYNGFFEYEAHASDFDSTGSRVQITALPDHKGSRIVTGDRSARLELDVNSPFPLVGGDITGRVQVMAGSTVLVLSDPAGRSHDHDLSSAEDGRLSVSTDAFLSPLDEHPMYSYTLTLRLAPATVLHIQSLRIVSDFQFARLALLDLKKGKNAVNVYFPDESVRDQFTASVLLPDGG